jgi:hypothetical protein
MIHRRGIRGPVFPGVITSSISFWDNMGLMIVTADVTAERSTPAANLARCPFK